MTKPLPEQLTHMLSKVGDLNFRRRVVTMLDFLDPQPTDVILDAGCGEGFYALLLSKLYGCKVVAVDNDSQILALAKKWLAGEPVVSIEEANIYALNYPDNYFDKVLCTEVLEHLTDDSKALLELKRVLKPGGVLAVTVPNKNYPLVWDPLNKLREMLGLGHFNPLSGFWGGIWAYDHKRLYSPGDLSALLKTTGLVLNDLKVLTHYGVPFNHLVLYVGKRFYTQLPVSQSVKSAMEKFSWQDKSEPRGFFGRLLQFVFSILQKVDAQNDREFSLDTPTMAVAARAHKEVAL